jgi:spore germination protein GerM
MPVLSTLKYQPWTYILCFCLVLLVVPVLSGCRGRTVLQSGGPKDSKKTVVGQLAKTNAVASLGRPGVVGTDRASKNGVTVWFTQADGDKLNYVSEVRESSEQFKDTSEAIAFALNELLAGPKGRSGSETPASEPSAHESFKTAVETSSETSSEIPADTRLIKVSDDKATGAITVDLSKRFIEGGGMDSFEARLEQVKRTIAGVAGGQPVYLNVEGERLTASGDGLEVQQPINASVSGAHPGTN